MNSNVVARIEDDGEITIGCTAVAEEVTDNGSTSSLWNKVDQGWIPDTNTNTGQVVAVMPTCAGFG